MLEVVKPGCLKAALERLEPCVGKLTSTVLMGLGFSNEPWLPDQISETSNKFTLHTETNGLIYTFWKDLQCFISLKLLSQIYR